MKRRIHFLMIICMITLMITACKQTDNNTKETTKNVDKKHSTQIDLSENDSKEDKETKSKDVNLGSIKNPSSQIKDKEVSSDKSEDIGSNQDKNVTKKSNEDKLFLDNVLPYFNMNKVITHYNGYAEYGHLNKFVSMKTVKDKVVLTYSGEMSDGYGEDERGKRLFTAKYYISGDTITEVIKNKDYASDRTDVLNSLIPKFIVLKGEIKEKNSWEQEVMVKGKEYKAKTTIIKVDKDSFSTETVIKKIKGYENNTYKETRVYKVGMGLFTFGNTPYYEGNDEVSDLIFGYCFSTTTKE